MNSFIVPQAISSTVEPLGEAMPQAETSRWKTIAVCSTYRLAAGIASGVGVRCKRCHEWMKHIIEEGHSWRPRGIVAREVDLEAEDCVGIRAYAKIRQ